MKECPNCLSTIANDSNICTKCGWRPYHGVLQGNDNYYPIYEQNFRFISVTSIILTVICICFYLLPLWINYENPSKDLISSVCLGSITLIMSLYVWSLNYLYKYLFNFYHPRDNIFFNIQWYVLSIIAVPILIIIGVSFQLSLNMEGLFSLLFIGIYVLWAFMQILIGWSLIKAEKYDYIGGLSILGYAMLATGIIPLFFFLIPIFLSNIFIKAKKYQDRTSSYQHI